MDNDSFDQWEKERRERQKERERRRAERRESERGTPEAEAGSGGRRSREGRKERVIHTRVSESLDDSIRRAADEMRVPVSNLVRNVLEDVFEVVEKVTDNMGDIVGEVLEEVGDVRKRIQTDLRRGERHARGHRRHRARRHHHSHEDDEDFSSDDETETVETQATDAAAAQIEREEFPDVVGWQPLILNGAQQCTDCGRDLLKGDKAFCGMTATGLSPRTLCPDCARARS